ncbi:MAG: hypothetical protein ACJ8BW_17695 [Ktedonobacteraceae bacterium]|jgi:hypothetical protein
MINAVREKVKTFLKETLDANELGEEVRIIGIENTDGGWIAEAEVAERNLTLPGYRVFEKKYYVVILTDDLEVTSYKQEKNDRDRE